MYDVLETLFFFNVDSSRILTSVAIGAVCGILGLENLFGIAFFLLGYLWTALLIFLFKWDGGYQTWKKSSELFTVGFTEGLYVCLSQPSYSSLISKLDICYVLDFIVRYMSCICLIKNRTCQSHVNWIVHVSQSLLNP